jgi:hypothetical protein
MIPLTLQDLSVTLVAAAAALVFVRRLIGPGRGRGAKRSCPSCAPSRADKGAAAQPVVFVRPLGSRPANGPPSGESHRNSCPPQGNRA